MADGDITIRIPGGSPPIPEVVINCFPAGEEHYNVSQQGLAEITQFSAYGTPEISGSLTDRYVLTVLAKIPEQDALRLGAIARWSSAEYKDKRDGHLELDFELEYVDPEPSGHGRSLIQTLTTSYGYEYGYPRYNVALTLPENYRLRSGNDGAGTIYSIVQFAATEV